MKRIVICCILTAVIFAGGITGMLYTSRVGDEIAESVREVKESFLAGDIEAARAAAEKASERWRKFRDFHILIADNGHALEITMSAERIERLLEAEDEEVTVECGVMEELITSYCREQEISLGNVF